MIEKNLDIKKKELGIQIGKYLMKKNISTNYVSAYAISREQNYIGVYIKKEYDITKIAKKIEQKYNLKTKIYFIEHNNEVNLLEIKTNIND